MKNALLLLAFCIFFSGFITAQHSIGLFGVPAKNDHGQKILPTPDNHYIVAGQSNNNAALYRYNCNGDFQVIDNQGCKGISNPVQTVLEPQADVEIFGLQSDTICTHLPLSSTLHSVINEASSYQWTFSNGVVSSLRLPDTSFDTPGNYAASLTVTTAPGQFLITEVTIISRESYFSITDPIPDLFILVKNNQGAEVYRSNVHYDVASWELPHTIPTALLVKNEFYIMEIWDYDAFDADDFLGEVFLANPTVPGVYTTGNASVEINPVDAEPTYTFSKNIVAVGPAIVENNGMLTATINKTGSFIYTWYKDGVQVASGLENTYLPPVAEGCYTVKVTGAFVCDEISAPYCFTVGTKELSVDLANGFTLAPQPLPAENDLLIIRDENSVELRTIELFNGVGQLIYANNASFGMGNIVVPTAGLDLSTGFYILRFTDSEGNFGARNVVVVR